MTGTDPKLSAALEFASEGIRVFPLKPCLKVPATAHGCHDGSTDPAQIEAWWRENPDFNLGLACGKESGIFVLDRDGAQGEETLATMEGEHGALPETRQVKTPRGRHYHFKYPTGREIKNSASKIGAGLDIRGESGYVVGPGSVNADGVRYELLNDAPPADAPDWLVVKIVAPKPAPAPPPPRPQAPASGDDRKSRCLDYVKRAPDSISGEGGDDALFRMLCEIPRFDLNEADSQEVAQILNEMKCRPAWPEHRVKYKLAQANQKVDADGERGIRNRAKPSASEGTAPQDEPIQPPLEPINFARLFLENPERGPVVIDGILRECGVGTLIGGSKTWKSWIVAMLIASALRGASWLGHAVTAGRVCLIDGELTRATINFRLRKVFESEGVDPKLFTNLDVFDLRGHTRDSRRAMDTIRARGPGYYKLAIIDPLYVFYPDDPHFSENDNAQMRRLYDDIIRFAGETHAGVVAVHHLSKGDQSSKQVTDLGSGAGTIARAGDAHLVMRPHREKGVLVFDGVVRDFPEINPTCWERRFPTFTERADLDPLELAGIKAKRPHLEKSVKPEPLTLDEFVIHYLSPEPRELGYLKVTAGGSKISVRAVSDFLKMGTAVGKIFVWPGLSDSRVKRYATVPPPDALEQQYTSRALPPTPPECVNALGGKGVRA